MISDADDSLKKKSFASIDNLYSDAAPKSDVLNEINSSGFKPTAFQPSALKEKSAPVMVDLTEKTYAGNPPPKDDEMADSIFHPNLLLENKSDKLNRWVKKLFAYRQKALFNGDLQT